MFWSSKESRDNFMDQEELRQNVIKTFHRRFATKKYDPTKKITEADWKTIIEAGRLSPNSFGYEPWKFLLINNDQIKKDLKKMAWGAVNSLNGADKFLIILARTDVTYDSEYVQHLVNDIKHREYSPTSAPSQHFKKFQEEDLAIKNKRELFDWASKQTYIALGNMLTTAAYLGIDSCPIEGFNRQKIDRYLADKGLLDLDHWQVSVMASFGYRDQPIKPKVRQPLSDIYQEIN